MARYIDFGIAIGSGSHFRLASYYRMCDEIVAALKEHPSLLEQHFARLDPRCWVDKSLHLLAFDLIWCSSTNHLYHGLTVPSTVRSAKKSSSAGQRSMETQQKIDALRQEIEDLEAFPDDTADISLLGVQVTSPQYGTGTVVGQNANKIDVQFGSLRKSFVLDEAYPARPRFEDDEAIVKAFTVYGRRCSRINALKRQLDALRR